MNVFLYILECMVYGMICFVGWTDKPLLTTGEPPTAIDALVGGGAWILIAIVIVVISFLVRHVKSKK